MLFQNFSGVWQTGLDISCPILQGVPVVEEILDEGQAWLFLFLSFFNFVILEVFKSEKIDKILRP